MLLERVVVVVVVRTHTRVRTRMDTSPPAADVAPNDQKQDGSGDTPVSVETTEQQLKPNEISAMQIVDWIRAHKGVCRELWVHFVKKLTQLGIKDVAIDARSYEYFRVTIVAFIIRQTKAKGIPKLGRGDNTKVQSPVPTENEKPAFETNNTNEQQPQEE